jgi:hypothetical protein
MEVRVALKCCTDGGDELVFGLANVQRGQIDPALGLRDFGL